MVSVQIFNLPQMPPSKRRKKWTISYLRNKAVWPVFSKYIRMKHADWRGNAKCVTCGKLAPWKSLQAGHFIPGRMNSILFDERGVFPQCPLCNGPLKGNPRKYDTFMRENFGQEVIDELDRLSNQTKSFTEQELIDMWNYYKEEIKRLEMSTE